MGIALECWMNSQSWDLLKKAGLPVQWVAHLVHLVQQSTAQLYIASSRSNFKNTILSFFFYFQMIVPRQSIYVQVFQCICTCICTQRGYIKNKFTNDKGRKLIISEEGKNHWKLLYSPESCPMNNVKAKKVFLKSKIIQNKISQNME